jgi:hypothetical protein
MPMKNVSLTGEVPAIKLSVEKRSFVGLTNVSPITATHPQFSTFAIALDVYLLQ